MSQILTVDAGILPEAGFTVVLIRFVDGNKQGVRKCKFREVHAVDTVKTPPLPVRRAT